MANDAIKQQDQTLDQSLKDYTKFLNEQRNSYIQEQTAIANSGKTQQLNDLQKSYDQALLDGQKQQTDVEDQFVENTGAINDEAYLQSQQTELGAQQRGIGNSQQLLALQSGDKRNTQNLMNENRIARDKRINDIKTRISQITNEHNMNVSEVNTLYNNNLQQINAQASQMYTQNMANMTLEQYKHALQMKGQLTLQEQEQLNTLERMETQQGYDLSKMAVQQQYTQENMAKQQQYTQDNMNLQYKLDLGKMKTQHGYDMEKIDTQFNNDLTKMAKQHGYDMSKIGAQHANQMAQINAQRKSAMAQADAQRKAQESALKNAYLNPNSSEYKIRMAQIDESHKNAYDQAYNKAMGQAKGVYEAENYTKNSANFGTYTSGTGHTSGSSGNIFTNFVDWVKGR